MPRIGEKSKGLATPRTRERADPFVATALPLLREYTTKLDSLVDQVQDLVSREADDISNRQKEIQKRQGLILMNRIDRLAKSTADLARRVSQFVEHGDLDDNSRFELRLRLADLEAAREAALGSLPLAIRD